MTQAEKGTGSESESSSLRSRRWWLGASGLLASALAAGVWRIRPWTQGKPAGSNPEEVLPEGLFDHVLREHEGASERNEVYGKWRLELALPYCFIRRVDDIDIDLMIILDHLPDHPLGLLLRACMALEDGRWDQARQDLVGPVLGGTPESRLLLGLVERRPRAQEWRQAFLESWQALEQPDFSGSTLLPAPHPPVVFTHERYWLTPFDNATPEQRYLLAMKGPRLMEARLPWFLEQVRACKSLEWLLVTYELLALNTEDVKAEVREDLAPAVLERLRELAGPSPQELRLALLPLLPKVPFIPSATALERQELEQLEQLVALPTWRSGSSEQTFQRLREALRGMVDPSPQVALFLTQGTYGLYAAMGLYGRARESQARLPLNEQRWLGKLLWEVGARLLAQRSRLEWEVGLKLQSYGAELTGHGPSREQAIERWGAFHHQEQQLARAALDRWPLPQLQVELCEARARDEVALLEAFAGR